jgi:hypothetical protein
LASLLERSEFAGDSPDGQAKVRIRADGPHNRLHGLRQQLEQAALLQRPRLGFDGNALPAEVKCGESS